MTKVSSFYAFATIAAGQLATLKQLQIDYNGNATGNTTNVSLRAWNWSTSAWVTVDGPVQRCDRRSVGDVVDLVPGGLRVPLGRGASERPWHTAVVLPHADGSHPLHDRLLIGQQLT